MEPIHKHESRVLQWPKGFTDEHTDLTCRGNDQGNIALFDYCPTASLLEPATTSSFYSRNTRPTENEVYQSSEIPTFTSPLNPSHLKPSGSRTRHALTGSFVHQTAGVNNAIQLPVAEYILVRRQACQSSSYCIRKDTASLSRTCQKALPPTSPSTATSQALRILHPPNPRDNREP
ncbi:hypothetical protein Q7P36_002608 [Cladosporium allicinum]